MGVKIKSIFSTVADCSAAIASVRKGELSRKFHPNFRQLSNHFMLDAISGEATDVFACFVESSVLCSRGVSHLIFQACHGENLENNSQTKAVFSRGSPSASFSETRVDHGIPVGRFAKF